MYRLSIALAIVLGLAVLAPSVGAAKYAGDPFTLGAGARGLALGGAVVAGPFDATAAYWNPAGMHFSHGRAVSAMHAETFGDLLNHDFVSFVDADPNRGSRFLAYGFYFYYLGGGGIKITDIDPVTQRFIVVSEESHADVLLAGSVSGRLNDAIDFGLTAKVIHRDIGTESGQGLTVDIGFLHQVSPNVRLGLMVSDATSGFIRYSGKTNDRGANVEAIYPTVKPGIMVSRRWRDFGGSLLASGDIKFEDLGEAAQFDAGSLSLDSHLGLELDYRTMFFGRLGLDIGRFTAGAGIDLRNISLDLAYLHHDDLDETFRVSAAYRWGN